MSAEVICLSSSDAEDDDENASGGKSAKKTREAEKKAQKRKWSPAEPGCSNDVEKKKKQILKPQLVVKQKVPIPSTNENVFQNFIKTCLERRDDEDTRKVLSKLEKQYNKLSVTVKDDNEFRIFISNCHDRITKGLSNDIYTPALDLYKEIKRHVGGINPVQQQQQQQEAAAADGGENALEVRVYEKKDMKKIKLLEKSIEACLKKIKELDEKEVDFDDDLDSAYIQADRYKQRLLRLTLELTKVSGDKVLRQQIVKRKIKKKDLLDEMTGISSVDEAILNFVNSDIRKINQLKYLETQRCADHVKMPEYLDIIKCIEKVNQEASLDLSKEKMTKLAKRAFQTVGNFLKKQRMDESKFYIQSLVDDASEDPAIKDVSLNKKLRKNKTEGDKKLEEIFKKYVDKQEGLSEKDIMEEQAQSSSEKSDYDSADENSDGNLSLAAAAAADDEEESSVEQQQQQVDDKKKKLDSNLAKGQCTTESTTSPSSVDGNDVIFEKPDHHHHKSLNNNKTNKQDNNSNKQNTAGTGLQAAARLTVREGKNALVIAAGAVAAGAAGDEDNDILVMSEKADLDAGSGRSRRADPLDIDKLLSSTASKATTAAQAQSESSEILQINKHVDVYKKSQNAAAAKEQDKEDEAKTSFIKVCAFAKPPPAWGDLSPKKVTKKCKLASNEQSLQDLPAAAAQTKPEYIDLTSEREKQTPSTRSINPMANVKRRTTSPAPVKRVVIVKNVINNYNLPATAAAAAAAAADQGGSSNDNGNIVRTSWLSKADKAAAAAAAQRGLTSNDG